MLRSFINRTSLPSSLLCIRTFATTAPPSVAAKRSPAVAPLVKSGPEWEARCRLAGVYRITHRFGWDELIYNHITLAVPSAESRQFLINPFGLGYDEITASSLLKIDL